MILPLKYQSLLTLRKTTGLEKVHVSAINFQFFSHRKCLDLIFIYLSDLMVSIGNLRLLKHPSFTDR